MMRNIKGIKIQGKCFLTEAKLDFFAKEKNRIALVYGRNGSGKTTISEGISYLKTPATMTDIPINVSFFDENDTDLTNIDYSNLFVFNERYCENNIKIADSDGLKTILLFGKQAANADSIKKLQCEIENLNQELNTKNNFLKTYVETKGHSNPDTYLSKVTQTLKDTWARQDADIKGNRKNSDVNKSLIDGIVSINETLSKEELLNDFNNQKQLYAKINGDIEEISENIIPVFFNKENEDNIIKLLATQIEKPILTEREQRIFNTMQDKMNNFVDESKKLFLDGNKSFCPYCYQDISQKYREEIIESIDKVLNKEVNEHKDALLKANETLPSIYLNEDIIQKIDKDLLEKIRPIVKQCTDKVAQYQKLISEKVKNTFMPIDGMKSLDLSFYINELNQLLNEVDRKRIDFNLAVQKKDEEKAKLINLNKRVARYNIIDDYRTYEKLQIAKNKLSKDIYDIDTEKKKKEKELRDLREQSSNEKLAVEKINSALNYIFFSENRFSVELKNNKYYLKSNGNDVSPKDVSVGERNILALCYFFTKMMTGKDVDTFYSDENFVIIDDPVSSFDFENKIGIISYLRRQINLIINGNPNSKVLIFSHDLETIYNLDKAMDEICKFSNGNAKRQVSELNMCNLQNYSTEKKSEYGQLLNDIYKYACNTTNDEGVGNKMRKVLEAFATFNYQKGIEEISYHTKIKEILGDYSMFFESLMYRLILNGESHYRERVNMMFNGYHFSPLASEEERRKIAKYILCFLFLINRLHIIFYIENDDKDVINTISEWIKDIPTNDKFES